MKHWLFAFFLVGLCTLNLYSQDLLVRHNGDSLNCQITKVRMDYVHFTFKHGNEVRKVLLPKHRIKYYERGYFTERAFEESEDPEAELNYSPWRLAINGGYSYRTSPLSDNIGESMESYYQSLKSGYNLGGSISYYFSEQFGIGAYYSSFNAHNELTSGQNGQPKQEDDVSINYVAFSLNGRMVSEDDKIKVYSNVGVGYMGYGIIETTNSKLYNKGNTVGWNVSVESDFHISKGVALGLDIGYLHGRLANIQVSNNGTDWQKMEPDEKLGLSRLDFSVGVKFYP